MEQVRYGIVGYGNMGSAHCRMLAEGKVKNAVLAAICDNNPRKLEAAREKFPGVSLFASHEDMFKSGLIDAVEIAAPHYFHPPIAIDAFNAGINVISEKPAGVYTKAVAQMNTAARKSGKAFGMMFNQRTNPMYRKMREMVQNGELGELYRCIWIITDWYRTQAYYDSGDWRATWDGEGGGVLMNQCPHQLDLWQWIFGMPTRIRAFCHEGHYHNIEVEDDVTAYAEYANGASGVFITTTGETPGTNRLEITGTKGKLVAEGRNSLTFCKNECDADEWLKKDTNGFAKPKCEKIVFEFENEGTQHMGIFQNFTDHLVDGAELLASGYEGINGLSIANAMMLSSWDNDWCELPIDADRFYTELKKRIDSGKGREKKVVEERIVDISDTYNSK